MATDDMAIGTIVGNTGCWGSLYKPRPKDLEAEGGFFKAKGMICAKARR